MPHLDIEFLQQFRKAEIDLPNEDRQYGNVFFRHFSGNRKEKCVLEELIGNQLVHSLIIEALTGKMEKEDMVVDRQLATFVQKLQKAFATFSRNEPASAARLQKLMSEVAAFSGVVREFQIRKQPLLLDALKNISAERKAARNAVYVGSRNVRTMQVLVRDYRDKLYFYHDVFIGFLDAESEKMGKVMVVSPIGNCLLNLTALILSRISAAGDSFNCLGEWKMRLRLAEKQGSYN
ncbi:MAG TPA: hypothetical protein VMH27_23115 [Puia sp.]|nr:hypothetical protein [Puia sp.]